MKTEHSCTGTHVNCGRYEFISFFHEYFGKCISHSFSTRRAQTTMTHRDLHHGAFGKGSVSTYAPGVQDCWSWSCAFGCLWLWWSMMVLCTSPVIPLNIWKGKEGPESIDPNPSRIFLLGCFYFAPTVENPWDPWELDHQEPRDMSGGSQLSMGSSEGFLGRNWAAVPLFGRLKALIGGKQWQGIGRDGKMWEWHVQVWNALHLWEFNIAIEKFENHPSYKR